MINYEKSKVDMKGITSEHIRMILQTIADIKAKHISPNIQVEVKVKEK